jgi:hypothetical protein
MPTYSFLFQLFAISNKAPEILQHYINIEFYYAYALVYSSANGTALIEAAIF